MPGLTKILHIINDLSIGGAEMMLYRLLSSKNQSRFESSVISLMDRGPLRQQLQDLGIQVTSPGMKPTIVTPQSLYRLLKLIRQFEPDLIHGWLYHGSLAAQLATVFSSRKIPVMWSIHYSMSSLSFEKRLTAIVMRICAPLSRKAAEVVFVSHTSQAQHGAFGYDLERSRVIPNGIDTEAFIPSTDSRHKVRSELGLSEGTLLVGLINRYHPMKDHANFLQAARLISNRYSNIHFVLAGRNVDENNHALMTLIRQHELEAQVHVLGERLDISRLASALDIFSLSSSHGESFPIIVGEAMSCGVPCVVTDVGDSAWIVGDTGLVVPPKDSAALARAWAKLIDAGAQTRSDLGAAARARVAANFSLPSVVSQYESLYDLIIAGDQKANQCEELVSISQQP